MLIILIKLLSPDFPLSSNYESQDIPYGFDGNSTLAGLSIGLFAGAAVSLSRSLADLAKNGSEAVRVAFRLGVYVDDISRKLESSHPDGTPQSWAHCVPSMPQDQVQDEIERYNTEAVSLIIHLQYDTGSLSYRYLYISLGYDPVLWCIVVIGGLTVIAHRTTQV